MAKVTPDDVSKLINNILLAFYKIHRDMPLPTENYRNENDAEHSWSLAVLACCIAKEERPDLDVGKVAQFAIAHDIVEVITGDYSVWAPKEELAQKPQKEQVAIEQISKDYSEFSWLAGTISDYQKQKSPEAIFVYALDKYINIFIIHLEKDYYRKQKGISVKDYAEFLKSHRQKAHTDKTVAKYYDVVFNEFMKESS